MVVVVVLQPAPRAAYVQRRIIRTLYLQTLAETIVEASRAKRRPDCGLESIERFKPRQRAFNTNEFKRKESH